MKVKYLASAKPLPYEQAVERLKKCGAAVDEFIAARARQNIAAANAARLSVSLFAPTGVYVRGDDRERAQHFVVFGVQRTCSLARENAFAVLMAKMGTTDFLSGEWETVPLIDTDGFLMPICSDGFRGERFYRVGDLLN